MAEPKPTLDDQLFETAKTGNVAALAAILDEHPDKLLVRNAPYEHALLHVAAFEGHLPVVDLMLSADKRIRDSKHESDAPGWAEFFNRTYFVQQLTR